MSYLPPLPKRQVASQAAYDAMRDKLRRVATYQRWVLLALLVNVVFGAIVISSAFQLISIPSSYLPVIRIARFPVCIFMTFSAFLLAKQFWHVVVAVVCGLMMWVPFASLIVLIVVNQSATRFLQKRVIKVGLLGANPSRI